MRLNVVLTDEQNEAITERAAAEGIPRAELIRQAISSFLEPAPCRDELPMSRPGAEEIAALEEKISTLETVTAERDHAIEVLARLTAENDRMTADLTAVTVDRDRMIIEAHEIERLRAEVVLKDQVIGERADEIRWLRGEVSKLNDKLTPATLPEQAGPGRRPWWAFWK
jgi:hypothetical protein